GCVHRQGLRVRLLDGLDDLLFYRLEVLAVDPADERAGSPQAERVGSLVVVRAGDEHIVEVGQLLADVEDVGTEEADQIDRGKSDLAFPFAQDEGPNEERIVDLRRLAILAEARDVDGLLADDRGDVRLAEADLEERLYFLPSPLGGE